MKIQQTLRDQPGGTPAAGVSVELRRHSDNALLGTDTTDAAGLCDFSANGGYGPTYTTATFQGQTRVTSSRTYGSGGVYSLYEITDALRALGDGVVRGAANGFAVSYDGAGLDLNVATGAAVVRGIPVVWRTSSNPSITATRDGTNPKACYLVVEVTPPGQTNEGLAVVKEVCGTAAASPTLPSLTQTDTLYQLPLATFRLPNTGSTTLTQVTDARVYCLTRNPTVVSIVRRTDPSTTVTTSSTSLTDLTGLTTTITLVNGVLYDLEAHAMVTAKVAAAGQNVRATVYLNGTSNAATNILTDETSYATLFNAHTLAAVAGTGAPMSCGVQWRVNTGAAVATATTGYLMVSAHPRW